MVLALLIFLPSGRQPLLTVILNLRTSNFLMLAIKIPFDILML